MIKGIGVDILHLPRLSQLIQRRGADILARRILCAREQEDFVGLKAKVEDGEEVLRFLAARWTAKEAAYKATYPSSTPTPISWKDLDVYKVNKKPMLRWSAASKSSTSDAGVGQFHLSLSHDGEYMVAYVIAMESV